MIAEIRGRGDRWRVFYPAETGYALSVPVFDREGVFKEEIACGEPTKDMTQAHFEGTLEEAKKYAAYLGATDVRIVRTKTPRESLAAARAARGRRDAA